MKCPSAEKGWCPSTASLNEHHSEWSSEYYCTTCGYEEKIKHSSPQRVQMPTTAVSKPKSKSKPKDR